MKEPHVAINVKLQNWALDLDRENVVSILMLNLSPAL